MAIEGESGGAAGLFANNTIFQIALWTILGQMLGSVLAPSIRYMQYGAEAIQQVTPLSPADLATAVNRGFDTEDHAATDAKSAGLSPERFHIMTQLAGLAPGPDALAEALRRKIIPEDAGNAEGVGFIQGIRQGNLSDKWADMVKGLAQLWPSPTDALDALLEGQIDQATATELYAKFGGDPQFFQLLYNTRGSAPTPTEAAVMANRGVIPWDGTGPEVTSFQQAFLEGPWRNKWLEAFKGISQYFPPPRTVTAMVKEGSLTDDQGLHYLKAQGLDDTLAAAYIAGAHKATTAKVKELAESTVVKLYLDQLIDDTTAKAMLNSIGYDDKDAGFILSVADLQVTEQNMRAAVSKIRTLFVSWKITKTTVVNALNTLQVPSAQASQLMQIWELERQANVKVPTEGQIASAFHYAILSQDEAQRELQNLGYQPHDAWLILSERNHAPLANEPAL